jgi:hypothetical protein
MATYPKDRFDSVPDDLLRTGAHRGPAKRGRGWVAFAWAALATGLIVLIGLVGLAATTGRLSELPFFPTTPTPTVAVPTITPTPTAVPKLNPTLSITVLNATTTAGLANKVGDALVKEGWGGAALGVGSRANAATTDVKATVVYYSDPANEGAARALVQSLKVGSILLSQVYSASPLTVVIGSDYKLP